MQTWFSLASSNFGVRANIHASLFPISTTFAWFFVHMIVAYNFDWADFKLASLRPPQTLQSFVAY